MKVSFLNEENVKKALENINVGLHKYKLIMDSLYKIDVAEDKEFQKTFNNFYKIRQRKQEFYKYYYKLLEEKKNANVTFQEIIFDLYKNLDEVHASFSSKLLATVNPSMPIWDVFVLKNLGLRKPYVSYGNRIKEIETIISLYERICNWYEENLNSNESIKAIEMFDLKFPNCNITNIKKVDFILWQLR